MFDFAARRQRLWRTLTAPGSGREHCDAFLITDETNVRYLSGFSGDSSYLLLGEHRQFILSDSRYDTQIGAECPDLELVTRTAAREMKAVVAETLRGQGWRSVAIESDAVTKATYDGFAAELPAVEFIDTRGLVLGLRAVKDAAEIALIRRSIAIAEAAFRQWKQDLRADWSELHAAHHLEHLIRQLGGQGRAFDTIVAGGPRAALPHAGATDQPLGAHTTLLLDWGAKFQGYCSDLTRVLVAGDPPAKLAEIHAVALEAHTRAIAAIRPGAQLQAVDAIARDTIAQGGFGAYFGHGLGHGFGLQIHESPRLSPTANSELEVGMIVTVEPGIYLPHDCGVRIEDDVLVTENGCEVLSQLPRSLADNRIDFR